MAVLLAGAPPNNVILRGEYDPIKDGWSLAVDRLQQIGFTMGFGDYLDLVAAIDAAAPLAQLILNC